MSWVVEKVRRLSHCWDCHTAIPKGKKAVRNRGYMNTTYCLVDGLKHMQTEQEILKTAIAEAEEAIIHDE